jgi:GDP-4-dehydro-6-deoxy-D-mannose reductase
MKPVALITGAHGFCARHLAARMAAAGDVRIVGLDCRRDAPAGVPLDEYVVADVTDEVGLDATLRRFRPDRIFHLAALMAGPAAELYRVNFMGSVRLLESVRLAVPDCRVLLVGSAAEYGMAPAAEMPISEECVCRPTSAYGISKYAATLAAVNYAQTARLKTVIARPFNIVGAGLPTGLVVGAVLERAQAALANAGEPVVVVGNLDTQRDFVAVDDVVKAYLRMLDGSYWGEVFNVCSGEPRTVRSVLDELCSLSPRPIRFEVDPALVRPNDVAVVYGSCRKARKAFGFAPSSRLGDALRAAWDFRMTRNASCG